MERNEQHYKNEQEIHYEVESAKWKKEWKEKQENCNNIEEEQIVTLHRNE